MALCVLYVDILNKSYDPFFYLRHKFISIQTIKSGNGLGQNGHCQETRPNTWTALEGIMKMVMPKIILCVGLLGRKEKIGG